MDRHTTPPFMLRLFYRTGAFHRPDEFTNGPFPPHITIHAWPDVSLTELVYNIAAAKPHLLPDPAVGTRVAFRLIFPDTRNNAAGHTTAKYAIKDLGSVVIGDGGRGLDPEDVEAEKEPEDDGEKTLTDARFVVGDFISCAVLPPLPNGAVAPVSSARNGLTETRSVMGRPPSSSFGSENGQGRPARPRNSGRGYDGFNRGSIPSGEWRRGERLPDPPPVGRGRGGRRY
ncbi:Sin3 associated polypeptide p18-domain-containing protein [Annulohypoxylon maeteangense]|uniref:Sin3 associated polypeptide p18-domain-containing protein n=1 Tax=Annulohypoxylon maeteangense TaxID=1927788 RepID=UPI0020074864|nr:Sin3 associated polypeptide p18-domain-containing protein [Annulohypoxylon maeteangense]KAI0881936.1 Sin3 associated polypeptide p18-domain-containing protein [Annulohypoxylon maeteangense]